MNRRFTARHVAEQSKQRGFAVVVIAQRVGLHLIGMPVEKRMVPVIKVGTIPADVVIIEPRGAETSGLETFTELPLDWGLMWMRLIGMFM